MAVRHDADPKALIAARKREAAKPGRTKKAGRGSGLTPRVRQAIDFLIFGDDNGRIFITDRDAADAAGLSVRSLRAALLKPTVEAYHRQQLVAKRNGLKALGLNTIEAVMTDPELKKTAAGAKVRVDAAKVVLVDPTGTQVNVQVNSSLAVTPGYVIDLEGGRRRRLEQLEQAVEDAGIVIPVEQVNHPSEIIDHE